MRNLVKRIIGFFGFGTYQLIEPSRGQVRTYFYWRPYDRKIDILSWKSEDLEEL